VSIEGPSSVHVGDDFQVTVNLAADQPITRLRSQLRFDPTALQLISATPGDVVPAAAGTPSVDAHAGGAQLEIAASPEDPVRGNGQLMVLRFKALQPRPMVGVSAMLSAIGGNGAATATSSAPPLNIAIQPKQ
jgi:hypothetical protein